MRRWVGQSSVSHIGRAVTSGYDRKDRASTSNLADRPEPVHIYGMTVKRTCTCGAIYELIESIGSSRDRSPFKCVLCEKELFAWEGENVSQFRLVWRPDGDRE